MLGNMNKPAAYDQKDVGEVEKVAERDMVVLDKKLTRSVLWKLDTRYLLRQTAETGVSMPELNPHQQDRSRAGSALPLLVPRPD